MVSEVSIIRGIYAKIYRIVDMCPVKYEACVFVFNTPKTKGCFTGPKISKAIDKTNLFPSRWTLKTIKDEIS